VDHAGVMELLTAADIFCFPTTSSEGFPKAVLEALACGLPVVSTRVSILAELLSDGGGVLLDDTSPSAIARAIRSCLDDRERYRTLSSAAVRTASLYSLEKWRDTIGSLLVIHWGPLRSPHA
jgi:glycosyltransferase involved in cell wall biosynthesis